MALISCIALLFAGVVNEPHEHEVDRYDLSGTPLEIHFLGHGTLMLTYGRTVIHIDPVSKYADYARMPKANIILITHHHRDHLDGDAFGKIATDSTTVLLSEECRKALGVGTVLKNGDKDSVGGIEITAFPAYNTTPERGKFHPKGRDNAYLLDFGGHKVFVGGDSENIPEYDQLKEIEIAFLAMNQPYTMTPEQVAEAAGRIKPAVLYPYHFGDTDTNVLVKLLKDSGIKVLVRKME